MCLRAVWFNRPVHGGHLSSRTSRCIAAVVLACLSVPVGGAALSWACSVQAGISTERTSGPPGTHVTVRGTLFVPGQPVEIRWNEVGGPVLATTRASADQTAWISTTVTIPNASPDTYALVAVGRDDQGRVAGTAPAPFTVTAPAGAEAAVPGAGDPRERPGLSSTTSGATGPRSKGAGSLQIDAGASERPPQRSFGENALPTASPERGDDSSRGGAAPRVPATSNGSTRGVSRRSASSDLWSGFATDVRGESPLLTGAAGGTKAGPQLLLGTVLGALGLLALAAAFLPRTRRQRPARR